MPGGNSARRHGLALVFVATLLWSSAGVFTRLVDHLDPWTILAGRAFFGGVCVFAVALVEWRRGVLGRNFGLGPLAPLIIALSAIAVSAYIGALKQTTVAEVMVIYATLPFVTAGLGFLVGGERTSPRTLIAAAIALLGVLVIVGGAVGTGRLTGQLLSLAMTIAFGLMIVLQRRHPGMSMTSINAFGSFVAAAAGFSMSPHPALSAFDLVVLALFGLTTICIAFTLFMAGAKRIPAAEAGLISMLDVVLGPLWVLIAFGEQPGPLALVGGALVLAALIWRLAPDVGLSRRRALAG